MKNIPESLLRKVQKWLGEDGEEFFAEIYLEHGRFDAVYNEDGLPHSVHFREGMQLRNFLRKQDECKHWEFEDFESGWVDVIDEVFDLDLDKLETPKNNIKILNKIGE